MNKIFVTSVNEDGSGTGVVPERDSPYPFAKKYDFADNYDDALKLWKDSLASLPTLLVHPSLKPVPGTFIESWQEGYEIFGTVKHDEWWPVSKEVYDAETESPKRKVAIPVTENKQDDSEKKLYELNRLSWQSFHEAAADIPNLNPMSYTIGFRDGHYKCQQKNDLAALPTSASTSSAKNEPRQDRGYENLQ